MTPTPAVIDTCSTCRFWESDQDVADPGRCHFNAPQAVSTVVGQRAHWPITYPQDWCGQYVVRA